MTDQTFVIRKSRVNAIGGLVLGAALLAVAFYWPWGGDRAAWWLPPAAFGVLLVVTGVAFFDRAPYLVLSAEGLAWRHDRRRPLAFLPWSEIRAAKILEASEEDPMRLNVVLHPRSPLEAVASEGRKREVEVPISGLEVSSRRLKAMIRQRAPHLFAKASRGG